jgi:hypothetical protein
MPATWYDFLLNIFLFHYLDAFYGNYLLTLSGRRGIALIRAVKPFWASWCSHIWHVVINSWIRFPYRGTLVQAIHRTFFVEMKKKKKLRKTQISNHKYAFFSTRSSTISKSVNKTKIATVIFFKVDSYY